MTNRPLSGEIAFVTGASRGIGRAIALALGAEGATVIGTATGANGVVAIDEALKAAGVAGRGMVLDVADGPAIDAAVADVESREGPISILVNNAGITRDTLIARMSDEDWQEVIDTNLRGTFNTCRAVSRKMLRRRAGAIVNLSSVVGVHGNPGQANYAASKAGIIGLTKALARELGVRGVRVNAIAPGYITTELTDVLTEEQTGLILGNTPLGRLGAPEDVAAAVRFLCSDEAAFITGDVLLVDGGLGI
jgi:3-oxoacyl-[acyl-carrier protein] reductase